MTPQKLWTLLFGEYIQVFQSKHVYVIRLVPLHKHILGGFSHVIGIGPGICQESMYFPTKSLEIRLHNQNSEAPIVTYKSISEFRLVMALRSYRRKFCRNLICNEETSMVSATFQHFPPLSAYLNLPQLSAPFTGAVKSLVGNFSTFSAMFSTISQ